MPDYIEVESKESTGSNFIWAVTAIIIVAIVAGVAYYGFKRFNSNTKHEVDIKIDAPAR